ncbi:MAG: hypothetical protein MN733_11075 [Nitrososphaera sp.]|nr:hypothetical protein [Nitrososphaera sp.]
MQTEVASQMILANLKSAGADKKGDPPAVVSLGQIKMWLIPQKSEHDLDYDINRNYFENLLRHTLNELIAGGYITAIINESIEDGDPEFFSLTQKGSDYVDELAVPYEEL